MVEPPSRQPTTRSRLHVSSHSFPLNSVRDAHRSLVKGFNVMIRTMRQAAKTNSFATHDLSHDPWLLEQE